MDKLKKIIIIYILIATVIFLAIIFIPKAINNSKKIPLASIDNKEMIDDTPGALITELEAKIYTQIQTDTGEKVNNGIVIRDNPHYRVNASNETEEIFIVDVDKVRQSYLVYYRYNIDSESFNADEGGLDAPYDIILFCMTDKDNVKYAEKDCSNSNIPTDDTLYLYLSPKTFEMKNGPKIEAVFQQNHKIALEYDGCSKITLDSSTKTAIKDWLESYGLKESDFTITHINKQKNCAV